MMAKRPWAVFDRSLITQEQMKSMKFLTVRELIEELKTVPEEDQDCYIDMNPGFCHGISGKETAKDAEGTEHTFVRLSREP
jgi:hypothetical protein